MQNRAISVNVNMAEMKVKSFSKPSFDENKEEVVDDSLPPDWRRVVTSDGRTYYFNGRTKLTSWVHPGGRSEPEPQPETPETDPSLLAMVTLTFVSFFLLFSPLSLSLC